VHTRLINEGIASPQESHFFSSEPDGHNKNLAPSITLEGEREWVAPLDRCPCYEFYKSYL